MPWDFIKVMVSLFMATLTWVIILNNLLEPQSMLMVVDADFSYTDKGLQGMNQDLLSFMIFIFAMALILFQALACLYISRSLNPASLLTVFDSLVNKYDPGHSGSLLWFLLLSLILSLSSEDSTLSPILSKVLLFMSVHLMFLLMLMSMWTYTNMLAGTMFMF